jgi:Uncharacterised protein family (UPF0182)
MSSCGWRARHPL